MNGSSVIARIDGTESMAKTMSAMTSAASAGDAETWPDSRALSFSTNAVSPSLSWRWRNIRQPVQISSAAKTKAIQLAWCSAVAPTTMNTPRSTSAATMPQVSRRWRSASGMPKLVRISRKTKTLSSDSDFSTR